MAVVFTIGEMRNIVKVFQNQPVDNATGGQQDNFVLLLSTRGKLTKISGRKNIEAGAIQYEKGYQLTIRFQQAITFYSDTRVNVDGTDYMITDWSLENEIRHLYNLTLNRIDG